MADLTSHRHEILSASEVEVERRMQNHYPDAVAILARESTRPKARFGSYMKRLQGGTQAMAEIGTRRKRTVQEPLREPSREPVRSPVPKKRPGRRRKVPA